MSKFDHPYDEAEHRFAFEIDDENIDDFIEIYGPFNNVDEEIAARKKINDGHRIYALKHGLRPEPLYPPI